MGGVEDTDQDDPERWGWSTIGTPGSRSYYSDHVMSAAGVAGPEAIDDPDRFDQPVSVDLDRDERQMLVYGLNDWGGPADGSDALAVAMGFASMDQLGVEATSLIEAIKHANALSTRDWTRALIATEFAFISAVLGTGVDEWTTINGGSEAHWFGVLRRLQRKLPVNSDALPG